jgi:ANTAR domain
MQCSRDVQGGFATLLALSTLANLEGNSERAPAAGDGTPSCAGHSGAHTLEPMDEAAQAEVLEHLHHLMAGMEDLKDFLDGMTALAAKTVSRAAGARVECAVTLRRRKRPSITSGSSEGCNGALQLPLDLGDEAAAVLDFFGLSSGPLSYEAVASARTFAGLAEASLRTVTRISNAEQLAQDLKAAMVNRSSIDLACGLIMAQNRCSQEEAVEILKQVSSNQNRKLNDVAEELVRRYAGAPPASYFDP